MSFGCGEINILQDTRVLKAGSNKELCPGGTVRLSNSSHTQRLYQSLATRSKAEHPHEVRKYSMKGNPNLNSGWINKAEGTSLLLLY